MLAVLRACYSLSSSLAIVTNSVIEDQVFSSVNVTLVRDDVYKNWLTNCFVRVLLSFYLKYIFSVDRN